MKPFEPISNPMEVEFFSILTDDEGKRFIHLHGYTYDTGEYWANMEACGIVIPLHEFISEYKRGGVKYVNQLYEEASQYQGDNSDDEIVEVINHYYRDVVFSIPREPGDGHPDAWLPLEEVAENTKDGQYITK